MPTTVGQLFRAGGLRPAAVVRWGEPVGCTGAGVYVVALTGDVASLQGVLPRCPPSDEKLQRWLAVRPELRLDGTRPGVAALRRRLMRFWLPDEVVLYVGQTTGDSVACRVAAYYATPLGARRPHAGGHWVKVMSNLDRLFVHYAAAAEPVEAEQRMLDCFCRRVSADTRAALFDPEHPFPFANLEHPKCVRKRHGLSGTREPRRA